MSEAYSAGDYAGLIGGDHAFYYGYEETNQAGEWLFVAKHCGEVVLELTAKEVGEDQWDRPEKILMIGVAKYLEEYL